MSIGATALYQAARSMELRLGELYEDISRHFPAESETNSFFNHMSAQEHMHASWVDDMLKDIDPSYTFADISLEDFQVLETTIDDIHDEVVEEQIGFDDALEMIIHLENNTAEDVYIRFPHDVPGLSVKVLERMIRSCVQHAQLVTDFREKRRGAGS